jgi:hypothetical protein
MAPRCQFLYMLAPSNHFEQEMGKYEKKLACQLLPLSLTW